VPAHKQKMFDAFGGSNYELPVTDWLTKDNFIAHSTELDEEQQTFIVNKVLEL
jgi:hypothetical protein